MDTKKEPIKDPLFEETDTRSIRLNKTPPVVYETIYSTDDVRTAQYEITKFQSPDVKSNETVWLHCIGRVTEKELAKLLKPYDIHSLVYEDILCLRQRPKIETYRHYVFCVSKLFSFKKNRLHAEQVSIVFGENFLISFQPDLFGDLLCAQQELLSDKNHICGRGTDFLAYALIDRIVDDYFEVLDRLNIRLEKMDNTLLGQNGNTLQKIHKLRRETISLRSALLPMQESLNMIMSGKVDFFRENTKIFMRDVVDHISHLISVLDSTRELINSMMDVYLSFQSNRLNEQMRVLTSITIIFMPLTLIAGIYGMNFGNMPELDWHYGYYGILGIMALIAFGLVYFFWKRKWF